MTKTRAPSQSLNVIDGSLFVVSNGANLGEGVSFADDLVLDDTYRLTAKPARGRLVVHPDGLHYRVSDSSEWGLPGARVCVDSLLTFMAVLGDIIEVLVLVELDPEAKVAASYLLPSAPFRPQQEYALVGIDTKGAQARLAQVAGASFVHGTRITMADGAQRSVETLEVGERVLTRDAGAQQIRWIGRSTARAKGELAPVRIRAGTLNNARDLLVSPDHRFFIHQRHDWIGAGGSDILVKARHLVNGHTVTVVSGGYVQYFQLLFDNHHMIFAEGIAAESASFDPSSTPALLRSWSRDASSRSTGDVSFAGIEVQERLLDRADATELLRRSSTSG